MPCKGWKEVGPLVEPYGGRNCRSSGVKNSKEEVGML